MTMSGEARKEYGTTDVPPEAILPPRRAWRWRRAWITPETKEDLTEICKLSFTIIAINAASNLVNPIALMFVGPLGVVELDGVGLATTLYNITAEAVTAGMTSASDTLFAQSYGSNNKRKVGIYLQQGLMIIMLFLLPTYAIHLNAESILLLLGQDRQVAKVTGRYLYLTIPGMFFFFLYRIMASYLRAVNYLVILLIAGVAGTAVNIGGHYLLVTVYEMGIEGSAYVQDMTYFVMFLVQFLFIMIKKVYKDTWYGWTKESFQNWGYFLYIGMGGFILWMVEWMGVECGSIFSGILGQKDLAAQAVLFQLFTVLYSFPFGFLIGGNVRIAMLLGSGDVERTKKNAKLSIMINSASTISVCILLIALRWEMPKIFSSDAEVIEMAANLMPIMALHLFMDGSNGGLSGILRGCGRHMTGVAISLSEYIVLAIPLSVALMLYTPLRVAGFWVATSIALFFGNSFFIWYIFFILDWKKEGEKALINAGVAPDTGSDQLVEEDTGEHVTTDSNTSTKSSSTLDIEADSETLGLLSYRDQAKMQTELRWRQFQRIHQLNLNPHLSFVDIIPKKKPQKPIHLDAMTLLMRRGGFVGVMVTILGISILTRIFLAPPDFTAMTPLCLPVNTTLPPEVNMTMPICNSTSII
ncbi:multidrug and toxin extrusion protein 1-like [Lineus longissimus]|uniref:multidrug and toxin extrusion protein 1-like n=1 Tax=Lineus longissimus TaxID=88925 RepID=UPI002B4DDEB6